ncbi:cytochrome P450 [Catenuloplanes japonicus]|uniref:cytochrome P450 n=1 Tax=Catenuloplanes japonicus TaxID=33876 RepID=UPI00068B9BAD|nr:cytochrome P450 [Catenuloplanes japonicus]
MTDTAFDRFAPQHLDDPYPLYAGLRERGPFLADEFGVWVVTRRADVKAVLGDPARFSSEFLIRTPLQPAPGVTEILATGHPEVFALLNQDPPDHTRVRALVAEGGGLTVPELISLMITLIFGGHETTTNLIGNALVRGVSRWAELGADPDAAGALVEETLRLDPPVQGTFRRTVAETELGGARIPAGTQVYAALGAANHDPQGYGEPHLGFGRGIHFCVGAQLARVEAHTVLRALAVRLPGLRLAGRPGYPANLLHRGPIRLDAVWPVP